MLAVAGMELLSFFPPNWSPIFSSCRINGDNAILFMNYTLTNGLYILFTRSCFIIS